MAQQKLEFNSEQELDFSNLSNFGKEIEQAKEMNKIKEWQRKEEFINWRNSLPAKERELFEYVFGENDKQN